MGTLFPKTINYKQISVSYVEGVAQTPVEVDSTFKGSVQPMSGKDVELLEIGREDRGKVKVYSSTKLTVGVEDDDTKPGDVVIWEGQKWEIIQEMQFQNDLIPHYKYVAEYRGEVS